MLGLEDDVAKRVKEPSWDVSPRLGSLEAYVYAYEHQTFEGAKAHLGIKPENASRAAQGFERWLRLPLLLTDAGVVERLEPQAGAVAVAAYMVLETFDQVQADIAGRAPRGEPSLYSSPRSRLRHADFKVFIAVARGRSYGDGTTEPGCKDVSSVRKKVRDLEKVLGSKLFEGRAKLRLSASGQKFLVAAECMVELMEKYKKDVSDFSRVKHAMESWQNRLLSEEIRVSGYISLCAGIKRPNAERRSSVEEAKLYLAKVKKALDELRSREFFEALDPADNFNIRTLKYNSEL